MGEENFKNAFDDFKKFEQSFLEATEIAKVKVLAYLSSLSIEEVVEEYKNESKDHLQTVHEWALEGEYYEVCNALKDLIKQSK